MCPSEVPTPVPSVGRATEGDKRPDTDGPPAGPAPDHTSVARPTAALGGPAEPVASGEGGSSSSSAVPAAATPSPLSGGDASPLEPEQPDGDGGSGKGAESSSSSSSSSGSDSPNTAQDSSSGPEESDDEDGGGPFGPPPPPPPPSPASGPPPQGGPGGGPLDFSGLFTVGPSRLGGLGAFAARELARGETILVERPLLATTHFRLMADYHGLSDEGKAALLGLHGGVGEEGTFDRVQRIARFNAFSLPYSSSMGGGRIAIFKTAARFNHACGPARNVAYTIDPESGVIELTVCADVVPAGAELFISYGASPADLYMTYGFRCSCGACTPLTDDDIWRLVEHRYGE